MTHRTQDAPNLVLLRGAASWLLIALLLAWCLIGLKLGVPFLKAIFLGEQKRLLQAHIDFLLMTALLLGFYAARVPLHWSIRWSMVIGAFTNSSLFLLMAVFPVLDAPVPTEGLFPSMFRLYQMTSVSVASYGFAGAAVAVLWSTFRNTTSHAVTDD